MYQYWAQGPRGLYRRVMHVLLEHSDVQVTSALLPYMACERLSTSPRLHAGHPAPMSISRTNVCTVQPERRSRQPRDNCSTAACSDPPPQQNWGACGVPASLLCVSSHCERSGKVTRADAPTTSHDVFDLPRMHMRRRARPTCLGVCFHEGCGLCVAGLISR